MVYAATLSESQRVMRWQINLEELGPNIQHIAGVDNIVADMLSRLPSTSSEMYKPCTRKDQCNANDLFETERVENNEDPPPANAIICANKNNKRNQGS